MKYLALDYGQKRTGVAVSDPDGVMAFPRLTIQMRGKDHFFQELLSLAEREKIEAFVVGLPLRQDGSDSETTRQVRNMLKRLRRRTDLPIWLVEESLSSWEAETRLREAGKKAGSMVEKLDQAAAVTILESFLTGGQATLFSETASYGWPKHGSVPEKP